MISPTYTGCFQLLAALVLATAVGTCCAGQSLTSHAPAVHGIQTSAVGRNSLSNFKVQLQHSLEAARIRRKRQAGLLAAVSDKEGFTADRLRVGSSAPGDLPYLSGHNLTMWTSLKFAGRDQIFVGTRRGDIVLLDVSDVDNVAQPVAYSYGEIVGDKVKGFTYGDQQWFVILQSSPTYSVIKLYQVIGQDLVRRQYINLAGGADFDLVTVRGIHYLAVSTYSTSVNNGTSYRAEITLYHWTRTQFDAIASRTTFAARSVVCWSIDGSLYLAVSQETDDNSNYMVGSPIYLFNAKFIEQIFSSL